METIAMEEGRYEQKESCPGSSSIDSDASSSIFESNESSEQISEDEEDLKDDLTKHLPIFYKSDANHESHNSNITIDEEFQAAALGQFMDILNDLDEVLDKSLLACLDDGMKSLDTDEEDLICKIKECIDDKECFEDKPELLGSQTSLDDDTQVVCSVLPSSTATIDDLELSQCTAISRNNFIRSKSFSEIPRSNTHVTNQALERANTVNDTLRSSMRRLDPIVLPAITTQESEPLTLPVILFLEHHVNARPTSSPIQLQVTAANLSSDGTSGPLIVGRRTLLMNRALSLPSPVDSDIATNWNERISRGLARSASASSSSEDSLPGLGPINHSTASNDRHEEADMPPFGVWPHRLSAMLACFSCTIGIFNISRFAIFSVNFGASFILQFIILSMIIGIPLFTLHLCLGQILESGPVDMWKISPIFQGVGISLLITQAVIGMYSIIGLSWIFIYFRDSFITSNDRYKWALSNEFNFDGQRNSTKIHETLPKYFHSEVLQRNANSNSFGTIKFQVALYLAVVWMIVFVSLSKGLRSYGKAVYVLIFLPISGTLVLSIKLLTLIPYDTVTNIFPETEWSEFFINSSSWAAAAQETYLTWGLLSACVMQLTTHKHPKHKTHRILQRESACIVVFTLSVLFLGAFLANTCVVILKNYGFTYIPSSFETVKSSQFLWPVSEPLPGNTVSTPLRYMGHYGSLVGITVWKTGNTARTLSGWQPLQLATQIVPATLAVLPANFFSPAWAVIFYFVLIMFGIAQQLAIWHCVITGIMAINAKALKIWETTITFLSCVFGLAVGLLLSTDAGVRIVHYIDYVWVGCWWQCIVQVSLAIGVFVVRGRPYSPDAVVAALYTARTRLSATLAALLSFTWTVVLPVLLCAICIMDFRTGQQRQLYSWRKPVSYWPIWARQLAVFLQQSALLIVPVTAFVQTWRYISKGPPDILEDDASNICGNDARVQNLYRPRIGSGSASVVVGSVERPAPPDPPPKYTPPPSYSTATGARLMHTLRRSFRTLRRITSTREETVDETSLPITLSESVDRQPPSEPRPFTPATVTDEPDTTRHDRPTTSRHSLTLTRDYLRRSFIRKNDSKIIRSSLRRSFKYGGHLTTSHEHLVRDIEPISNTVAMSAMTEPHTRSLGSVI